FKMSLEETFGQVCGISNPKYGSCLNSTLSKSPRKAALITALVSFKLILFPCPFQPVFNNQTFTPVSATFLLNIAAYLVGCKGINGAPKQVEKVVCGSVTPASVPATLDV